METAVFRKQLSDIPLNQEAESYLKEIIQNLPQDLSPDRAGYYSLETEELLTKDAAERLAQHLKTCDKPVSFEDLRSGWNAILVDYHRHNNWNYPVQAQKPVKELTEDQKTARELWPYIWVMIQSMIILKTAVYYFGITGSADPSTSNTVMLVLAILTSFGTLGFFAWRKSRK